MATRAKTKRRKIEQLLAGRSPAKLEFCALMLGSVGGDTMLNHKFNEGWRPSSAFPALEMTGYGLSWSEIERQRSGWETNPASKFQPGTGCGVLVVLEREKRG